MINYKNQAFRPVSDVLPAVITQDHPAPNCSSRYSFIPTTEPLAILKKSGWYPFAVGYQNSKRGNGFQPHAIMLRRPGDMDDNIMRTVPQIVLYNSHRADSSFRLFGGLFEKICSNGLIVSQRQIPEVVIRHVGYTTERVVDAIERVVDGVEQIHGNRKFDILLDQKQVFDFAEQAARVRYGDRPALLSDVVFPRRKEQAENTLWNVFNRSQENILGGIKVYVEPDPTQDNDTGSWRHTPPIKSLQRNHEINCGLWDLATEWADRLS